MVILKNMFSEMSDINNDTFYDSTYVTFKINQNCFMVINN